MILFEIDLMGIPLCEREGDAPRSIHMDAITVPVDTLQLVKIETRNVYVGRLFSCIKGVEPLHDSSVQTFVYLASSAVPKLCQFLMAEVLIIQGRG